MLTIKAMHFLTGEELSQKELLGLIESANQLKLARGQIQNDILKGKSVALVFEKPSLRTRLSFTVAINELGGQTIELLGTQKKNEEPEDTIRVIQGMVHGVMLRVFEHNYLERMITKAKIPVINGLSDLHHPCQALGDLLTLRQHFGQLRGLKLCYIGDGNNVLNSLLLMAPFLGVDLHYACPEGYLPQNSILERAQLRASIGGGQIRRFKTPLEAVHGTHAVYTDVWTSMGFEKENEERLKAFAGYQLNLDLFSWAHPEAIVMHCLPMLKGQEITEEVAEHPRSLLFQQAENRLHAQKALLLGIYNNLQKSVITNSEAGSESRI